MNPSYEITLNYIENIYDLTDGPAVLGTYSGTRTDVLPYYEGRIIRLGVSATGSTWNEALDNTILAASGSTAFNTSY